MDKFDRILSSVIDSHLGIPDDANGWHEYAGSDPNGVKTLMCPNKDSEIWNLAGQRLQKVQRGVNVVGGKKVLMK